MGRSSGLNLDKKPVPCGTCGRLYRADLIKKCPGCAAISEANNFQSTSVRNVAIENQDIGANLDDLVRAQNRTTHAVRAFVRFLFIQLSGITFAVLLWNISLAWGNGNAFLQFLAAVVWIVSVVWSSKAGWEELEKSNIV